MSFPKTVSVVIQEARDAYPDMTGAKALNYFLNAWRDLSDAVGLRSKAQTILITAGTREYDVPADVIDISSVYYQRTSDPTTWKVMYVKRKDELDLTRLGWRTAAARSEPFEFYVDTAVDGNTSKAILGLVQLPDQTSSAGYTCLGIFGQVVTDMLTTDTLPAFLNTSPFFVASIKRQFAEIADTPNIGTWRALEEDYLGKLTKHVQGIAAHTGTRLIAGWTSRMSRAK